MKPLFAAALEVQQFLRSSGERFCFIGGIALQRWGEPRFTRDVDLTLLCQLGSEEHSVDRVLSGFGARIEGARSFALANRVLLVQTKSGIPIDVALGGLPYEERCVDRASEFDFGTGLRLLTCSSEDLVIMKAFAGRQRDWADIESILVRQRRSLDWHLVLGELKPLLDLRETPENLAQLLKLRDSIEKAS
jgi:hypothetical protein